MTSLVFYFQVHQPFRLRRYTFFDIGVHDGYFDDTENARIVRRVAEKCYLPMTDVLLKLVEKHEGKFKCAFSVSGTALEQMELWSPESLANFQRLAATGCVEFLCETSHHSLAFLADREEFEAQVKSQKARIKALFGKEPTAFRNTELVVDNRVARWAEELGFKAILGEGADHLLGWRSAHRVYRPETCERIKILLRSYKLSDDIAFRFSNRAWSEWPLTTERFASWVHALPPEDQFVGLFMDFETFGEHQWKDTGIFDFMSHLPEAILRHPRFSFATPSEIAARFDPISRLDIPHPVSWADAERDLTAWLGNHMQRAAHEALYSLAPAVRKAAAAGRTDLYEKWKKLTTSDHVYYQCTKWFSDGDVHKYFSPYSSPHDAFIAFMNVLDDLARRVARVQQETPVEIPTP
ncbi:MAG: polysaccharide deacetylase family protein [Planctomycetes bacterium]|nr:polysaccharide deacetylase family protein [Planctomycetota bacterium]